MLRLPKLLYLFSSGNHYILIPTELRLFPLVISILCTHILCFFFIPCLKEFELLGIVEYTYILVFGEYDLNFLTIGIQINGALPVLGVVCMD